MTRTSQRQPLWQADASQSGRPCSTSSTNWNWSEGSLRRNTSFSSGELTVIVQTVVVSARAASGQVQRSVAANRMNFGNASMANGTDGQNGAVLHVRRLPTEKSGDLQPPDQHVDQILSIGRLEPVLAQCLQEFRFVDLFV